MGGLPYKKHGELVVNFEKNPYEVARPCPLHGRALNFFFTSKRNQLNQN